MQCHTTVARPSFKRRATAVLKWNLIEFNVAAHKATFETSLIPCLDINVLLTDDDRNIL